MYIHMCVCVYTNTYVRNFEREKKNTQKHEEKIYNRSERVYVHNNNSYGRFYYYFVCLHVLYYRHFFLFLFKTQIHGRRGLELF